MKRENSDIGLNQKVHKQGKIFEQKGSYTQSFKTLASFKEKIEKNVNFVHLLTNSFLTHYILIKTKVTRNFFINSKKNTSVS